ncbi:MAG: DUF6338 family protein [Rhizobiaceae bacterium]
MGVFSDPQIVLWLLALVVPGLVITFMRAQFVTGRIGKHSEALLAYFTLSAVYGAIIFPFLSELLSHFQGDRSRIFLWFFLVFVGPSVFGIFLGLMTQTELVRRLLSNLRIYPVHAVPTAWDWKFGAMNEHLVILTLKDDTKFAGYCGRQSFMSSDPHERDLYVEKVYRWGENESWLDQGEHGLWVASDELKTIEFFPVSEKGDA